MIAHGQIALITSTSRYFKYIIRHKGIVFWHDDELYIVHRTVKGVEIITLNEFLATRKLLKSENFCNDFINEFSTQHRSVYSEQIIFWLSAGAILLVGGVIAAFLGLGWLTIICSLMVLLQIIITLKSNYDYVK